MLVLFTNSQEDIQELCNECVKIVDKLYENLKLGVSLKRQRNFFTITIPGSKPEDYDYIGPMYVMEYFNSTFVDIKKKVQKAVQNRVNEINAELEKERETNGNEIRQRFIIASRCELAGFSFTRWSYEFYFEAIRIDELNMERNMLKTRFKTNVYTELDCVREKLNRLVDIIIYNNGDE